MCAIEITTGPGIPKRLAVQDTELMRDGKEMLECNRGELQKNYGSYHDPTNTTPIWSQATYSSEKRTVSRATINVLRTSFRDRLLLEMLQICETCGCPYCP